MYLESDFKGVGRIAVGANAEDAPLALGDVVEALHEGAEDLIRRRTIANIAIGNH